MDDALASVQSQTYADWELIAIDDGSDDGTPARLRVWAAAENRIRVERSDQPRGIVASLNRALALARAPLLARMDADDLSLPTRFARQRERLAEGDVGAVGCQVEYFPREELKDGARRYESWLNSLITPDEHVRDLFVECPLAHPTLMVRAEVLHQLGGYRAMGWAEDYDLCLRLWRAGVGLAKVPEVLFRWRDGRSRASRTLPEYAPEAFRQCKATFLQESYLADGRAPLLFGAGPVGKAMARALLSRGMRLAGFVDLDPRKVGQCIYGVQVLDQEHALALQGTVFGLAAVGQVGGRQALRATLGAAGWADGVDYCAVA